MTERNLVRIIGGKWRSRTINFASISGLRPTQDRIRETLFNWLQPYLVGASCLDLFAGSGVLGFEALSRGAKKVCFIDNHSTVTKLLAQIAERFAVSQSVSIILGEIPKLSLPPGEKENCFDIVFLDPPFRQNLLSAAIGWLIDNHLVANESLIYIETEKELTSLPIPSSWEIVRQQCTATLAYYLIRVL